MGTTDNTASPLTPEQARAALQGIEQAAAHSTSLYRYRQASPFFFVWAAVWLLGYGASDLLPAWRGPVWLLLDAAGVALSVAVARRQFLRVDRRAGWRIAGLAGALFGFIFCALVVFAPVSGRQVSAFIPLVAAVAYTAAGLWLGLRFVVTGTLLAALTLVGYLYVAQHFDLWMAVVGGSALLLAGVWLRRV